MSRPANLAQWRERIREAARYGRPVRLRGSGSKDFLAQSLRGEVFDTHLHQGLESYEPSELVATVRAGTRLAELEGLLAEHGQRLGFEPPYFGSDATVGGCVASGLSGPARATAGAVRDFVLGVRIMNGEGEILRFGGEVMKNVAGFDISRLMTGAWGTLGLILDVSFKLVPIPHSEATVQFDCAQTQAIAHMNRWAASPLPVSASMWHDNVLSVRLSGSDQHVREAARTLGGERLHAPADKQLWQAVREHERAFFTSARDLWRVSLPSAAPALDLAAPQLLEWGGAQRWVQGGKSNVDAQDVRREAERLGGHAVHFRTHLARAQIPVFHPLAPALHRLHVRLKQALDPHGIFNPGRMYADL